MDDGQIALEGPPSSVYSEEAKLLGVGIPKVSMLFNLLKKDGYNLGETPVTIEEASQKIRKCF